MKYEEIRGLYDILIEVADFVEQSATTIELKEVSRERRLDLLRRLREQIGMMTQRSRP